MHKKLVSLYDDQKRGMQEAHKNSVRNSWNVCGSSQVVYKKFIKAHEKLIRHL